MRTLTSKLAFYLSVCCITVLGINNSVSAMSTDSVGTKSNSFVQKDTVVTKNNNNSKDTSSFINKKSTDSSYVDNKTQSSKDSVNKNSSNNSNSSSSKDSSSNSIGKNDIFKQLDSLNNQKLYTEKIKDYLLNIKPVRQDSINILDKQIAVINSSIDSLKSKIKLCCSNPVDTNYWENKTVKDSVSTKNNEIVLYWTSTDTNKIYKVQIATDSLFKNIIYSNDSVKTNHIVISADKFSNGTTIDSSATKNKRVASTNSTYWRVGNVTGAYTVWTSANQLTTGRLTGISEDNVTSISISPNPVEEQFSLNGLSNVESVKIYSTNGNLVKNYASQDLYNVGGLQSGLYLLEVTTSKSTLRSKIAIK